MTSRDPVATVVGRQGVGESQRKPGAGTVSVARRSLAPESLWYWGTRDRARPLDQKGARAQAGVLHCGDNTNLTVGPTGISSVRRPWRSSDLSLAETGPPATT